MLGMNVRSSFRFVFLFIATAFLLFLAVSLTRSTSAQQNTRPNQATNASPATGGQVARGKYLVEEVAFCINCHTPRDSRGVIDRTRLLQGTPLFFRPAEQIADWPILAPRIGGTPPGTDQEMVTLLTTTVWKDGKTLRDPMPKFHMTREDAEAVVAYLKSLNAVH
jgi:mono/diheme cytochrome c family protein